MPRSVHVGFVMDKVSLGQAFLQVMRENIMFKGKGVSHILISKAGLSY
jgi:hypothetical protein